MSTIETPGVRAATDPKLADALRAAGFHAGLILWHRGNTSAFPVSPVTVEVVTDDGSHRMVTIDELSKGED